jgi:hypothetical protein
MKQYTTWINQGTNVNWQIWIDTFNESLASWTYAAAAVISFTDVEYRSYKNTGHYYQWPVGSDQYRTGVWSNYQGRQVIVYCAATMGNDNGGNARSYAKVWW